MSEGLIRHLHTRDTSLVYVSRAPLEKIERYKASKGWTFPWYSSYGSDFNYDFHAERQRLEQLAARRGLARLGCPKPASSGTCMRRPRPPWSTSPRRRDGSTAVSSTPAIVSAQSRAGTTTETVVAPLVASRSSGA